MCKCGDIFGGWWMKLLYMNSLSPRHVGVWHTFFGYTYFVSFCIAHTFFYDSWREIVMVQHGALFLTGWMDVLAIFQV